MAQEEKTVTTPEEVDVESTAEEVEETQEEASEESDVEETTEESSEESTTEEVDYKAIAEQERAAREKAEKALAEKRFKSKGESTEESDSTDDDEDRPMTVKEAREFMAQQQQETLKSQQESQIKSVIADNTSSEDEADAAYQIYLNRVVPTGNVQEDAMAAIAITNVHRSKAITEELKRSLKAKDGVTTKTSSNTRQEAERDEPHLTSADRSAIKSAGMQWDAKRGLYTKSLAGGKKTMFYDPKRPQGQKNWVA